MSERDHYPTGTGSSMVTPYAVDGWDPALSGATASRNVVAACGVARTGVQASG